MLVLESFRVNCDGLDLRVLSHGHSPEELLIGHELGSVVEAMFDEELFVRGVDSLPVLGLHDQLPDDVGSEVLRDESRACGSFKSSLTHLSPVSLFLVC
jgi:hypothetical protein